MRRSAPLPILIFAGAAHGMNHVLLTLFYTLVLVIGHEWKLDYATLIALWAPGAMLVGLGAPAAGWLGDKLGETRVLILCFLGLGVSAVLCGFAQGPLSLEASLALLGLSGSIYHPAGSAWVVKHAMVRGRAIALTGYAGSLGVALGPITAGALATLWNWRVAFVAPGLFTIAIGCALLWYYMTGRIADREGDAVEHGETHSRAALTKVFAIMTVTMTVGFVANSAFGTALPKLLQSGIGIDAREIFTVGLMAGAVQLVGASAQFIGGHLVDRGAAKAAYVFAFAVSALAYPVTAILAGWSVAFAAIAVLFLFEWTAPIETTLIARYTPAARRGFIFGIRYALATIGTPAGVWLIAALYSPASGFLLVMEALSVLSVVALAAAAFLPASQRAASATA